MAPSWVARERALVLMGLPFSLERHRRRRRDARRADDAEDVVAERRRQRAGRRHLQARDLAGADLADDAVDRDRRGAGAQRRRLPLGHALRHDRGDRALVRAAGDRGEARGDADGVVEAMARMDRAGEMEPAEEEEQQHGQGHAQLDGDDAPLGTLGAPHAKPPRAKTTRAAPPSASAMGTSLPRARRGASGALSDSAAVLRFSATSARSDRPPAARTASDSRPPAASPPRTAARAGIGPSQAPAAAPSLTSPPPIHPARNSRNSGTNPRSAPARPSTTLAPATARAAIPATRIATLSAFGMRRQRRSQAAAAAIPMPRANVQTMVRYWVPPALSTALPARLNMPVICVRKANSSAISATAMTAVMMPYSTAFAPSSSFHSRIIAFFI